MTEQQKRAAGALSLTIVTVVSAYLSWLAIEVGRGAARGDQAPGLLFMLAISNWDALSIMLKAAPIIISVGLALMGSYQMRDALFYALLAVSAVGVAATIYLLLELNSISIAKEFWQYSTTDIADPDKFSSAVRKTLVPVGAWLVGVIGIELGITTKVSAWVKSLF